MRAATLAYFRSYSKLVTHVWEDDPDDHRRRTSMVRFLSEVSSTSCFVFGAGSSSSSSEMPPTIDDERPPFSPLTPCTRESLCPSSLSSVLSSSASSPPPSSLVSPASLSFSFDVSSTYLACSSLSSPPSTTSLVTLSSYSSSLSAPSPPRLGRPLTTTTPSPWLPSRQQEQEPESVTFTSSSAPKRRRSSYRLRLRPYISSSPHTPPLVQADPSTKNESSHPTTSASITRPATNAGSVTSPEAILRRSIELYILRGIRQGKPTENVAWTRRLDDVWNAAYVLHAERTAMVVDEKSREDMHHCARLLLTLLWNDFMNPACLIRYQLQSTMFGPMLATYCDSDARLQFLLVGICAYLGSHTGRSDHRLRQTDVMRCLPVAFHPSWRKSLLIVRLHIRGIYEEHNRT